MSTQITFIVGPTATGKSALAFQKAIELNADILSADSRQVYKELRITSGADLPEDFQSSKDLVGDYPYFSNEATSVYGLSFLNATREWSIAHFRELAEHCLTLTQQRNKNLIIVGGSGLYVRSLFLDKNQLNIQPNTQLRTELQEKTLEELQHLVLKKQPEAESQFTESDWKNPRRLVRWLEINEESRMSTKITQLSESPFGKESDHSWIFCDEEKEAIQMKILERVQARITQGAIEEVEHLLNRYPDQKLPTFSTLGVREIHAFLTNQLSKEELIEVWSRKEFQYAKRQITWFKKWPERVHLNT
jgi:tRNA dimethylallyltransferase